MKSKIDAGNMEKLNTVLADVQGRSAVNVLDAEDLLKLAREPEERLECLCIPKVERAGASYSYAPEGPWANSYQYGQGATGVRLVRQSSAWYLVQADRIKVYPRQRERRQLTDGLPRTT